MKSPRLCPALIRLNITGSIYGAHFMLARLEGSSTPIDLSCREKAGTKLVARCISSLQYSLKFKKLNMVKAGQTQSLGSRQQVQNVEVIAVLLKHSCFTARVLGSSVSEDCR